MTTGQNTSEPSFIWATRGRTWGFRFLRSGGFSDPLPLYEQALAQLGDESEGCARVGDRVALRFPDPLGRQDSAGRVIPHDFVLLGSWADNIESLDEGIRQVWPLIGQEFEAVWDRPEGPAAPMR